LKTVRGCFRSRWCKKGGLGRQRQFGRAIGEVLKGELSLQQVQGSRKKGRTERYKRHVKELREMVASGELEQRDTAVSETDLALPKEGKRLQKKNK